MNVCKTSQSCISPILLILTIQYSFGIVFRNTPQDLDGLRDNSSVIVAGSVIQLFCSASGQFNAPRIQWTRNNVTIPETAQLPHLMIKSRTENLLTTSTFVIAGFLGADNGSYGCLARETGTASLIASPQLLLTATESSGAIKIIRELSIGNSANLSGLYSDDRTYVALGSDASSGSFLRCSAEQPGPSSLGAPSMVWLKDGTQLFGDGVRVVINTNTSIAGSSNRTVSFARIFNFSQSDAGVYQCVFYDTPSQGGEMITTRPYKVDTGPVSFTLLCPISLSVNPPDPLVIQVEAGGEYAGIQWMRTPVPLNASNGELVDFQRTFVRTVTAEVDWGLYSIWLVSANGSLLASVNITVGPRPSPSISGYVSPQQSTAMYGFPSPAETSTVLPGTPSVAMSVVVVIATSVGVVSGVVIIIVLVAVLCAALALMHRRKPNKESSKPEVALYEDLDGNRDIRMYETVAEVNNTKPVFEYFEDIPATMPTIVAHSPGHEGFESLYEKDGGQGNVATTDTVTTANPTQLCQPYSEPRLSQCSKDSFPFEGDVSSSLSSISRLPAKGNRGSSSLLLRSRSTGLGSQSPTPLRAESEERGHDNDLRPSPMQDSNRAKSSSLLERGPSAVDERPPQPIPRGTPSTSRKSSPAASLTADAGFPGVHPPGYPYSYVSRGDLLVSVRTGSSTFSAHNSPATSRHCSRENSVSRNSPAPHSGSCDGIVAIRSSVGSQSSQT